MSTLATRSTVMEAAAEHDVLTTAHALTHMSRSHLRAQLAAGRWQRVGRGVIVTHNGPMTEQQQVWAALLSCAPGSVLGGLTALTADGFTGWSIPANRFHVVLRPGTPRPSAACVVPHWSTKLDTEDVHPLQVPPRTRAPRSLVDEAAWSKPPRRVRAVILAGIQQGLARPSDLRRALERRGACRHRALIKESIGDADGGIHSLPERDFDLIRRGIGAPAPERQQVLRRSDGRYYLDCGWSDLGAAVEVHGIPHLAVLNWDHDLLRANEIGVRAGGWTGMRLRGRSGSRNDESRVRRASAGRIRTGERAGPPKRDPPVRTRGDQPW